MKDDYDDTDYYPERIVIDDRLFRFVGMLEREPVRMPDALSERERLIAKTNRHFAGR